MAAKKTPLETLATGSQETRAAFEAVKKDARAAEVIKGWEERSVALEGKLKTLENKIKAFKELYSGAIPEEQKEAFQKELRSLQDRHRKIKKELKEVEEAMAGKAAAPEPAKASGFDTTVPDRTGRVTSGRRALQTLMSAGRDVEPVVDTVLETTAPAKAPEPALPENPAVETISAEGGFAAPAEQVAGASEESIPDYLDTTLSIDERYDKAQDQVALLLREATEKGYKLLVQEAKSDQQFLRGISLQKEQLAVFAAKMARVHDKIVSLRESIVAEDEEMAEAQAAAEAARLSEEEDHEYDLRENGVDINDEDQVELAEKSSISERKDALEFPGKRLSKKLLADGEPLLSEERFETDPETVLDEAYASGRDAKTKVEPFLQKYPERVGALIKKIDTFLSVVDGLYAMAAEPGQNAQAWETLKQNSEALKQAINECRTDLTLNPAPDATSTELSQYLQDLPEEEYWAYVKEHRGGTEDTEELTAREAAKVRRQKGKQPPRRRNEEEGTSAKKKSGQAIDRRALHDRKRRQSGDDGGPALSGMTPANREEHTPNVSIERQEEIDAFAFPQTVEEVGDSFQALMKYNREHGADLKIGRVDMVNAVNINNLGRGEDTFDPATKLASYNQYLRRLLEKYPAINTGVLKSLTEAAHQEETKKRTEQKAKAASGETKKVFKPAVTFAEARSMAAEHGFQLKESSSPEAQLEAQQFWPIIKEFSIDPRVNGKAVLAYCAWARQEPEMAEKLENALKIFVSNKKNGVKNLRRYLTDHQVPLAQLRTEARVEGLIRALGLDAPAQMALNRVAIEAAAGSQRRDKKVSPTAIEVKPSVKEGPLTYAGAVEWLREADKVFPGNDDIKKALTAGRVHQLFQGAYWRYVLENKINLKDMIAVGKARRFAFDQSAVVVRQLEAQYTVELAAIKSATSEKDTANVIKTFRSLNEADKELGVSREFIRLMRLDRDYRAAVKNKDAGAAASALKSFNRRAREILVLYPIDIASFARVLAGEKNVKSTRRAEGSPAFAASAPGAGEVKTAPNEAEVDAFLSRFPVTGPADFGVYIATLRKYVQERKIKKLNNGNSLKNIADAFQSRRGKNRMSAGDAVAKFSAALREMLIANRIILTQFTEILESAKRVAEERRAKGVKAKPTTTPARAVAKPAATTTPAAGAPVSPSTTGSPAPAQVIPGELPKYEVPVETVEAAHHEHALREELRTQETQRVEALALRDQQAAVEKQRKEQQIPDAYRALRTRLAHFRRALTARPELLARWGSLLAQRESAFAQFPDPDQGSVPETVLVALEGASNRLSMLEAQTNILPDQQRRVAELSSELRSLWAAFPPVGTPERDAMIVNNPRLQQLDQLRIAIPGTDPLDSTLQELERRLAILPADDYWMQYDGNLSATQFLEGLKKDMEDARMLPLPKPPDVPALPANTSPKPPEPSPKKSGWKSFFGIK